MQLISAHDGKLLRLNAATTGPAGGFVTGLPLLDTLLPGRQFARGAVHELLTEPGDGLASFFAMVIARAALGGQSEVQNAECRMQSEKARWGTHSRLPSDWSMGSRTEIRQTSSEVGQTFLSAIELASGEVLFSRANSSPLGGLKPALARMSAPPKKARTRSLKTDKNVCPTKESRFLNLHGRQECLPHQGKPLSQPPWQTRMSAPPEMPTSWQTEISAASEEILTPALAGRHLPHPVPQNFKFQIEEDPRPRFPHFDFFNFQFSIFNSSSTLICSDPFHQLYPPALAAYGIPLDRLLLLRPRDLEEQTWAVAECLRCRGVGAVVAAPAALSRTEARRLQLAAEQGGGVGLLLRTTRAATHYAAATRWLVRPAPGQRTVQRWNIQLIHGHGGRIGQTVCLEHCRETHRLRVSDPMARGQDQSRREVARAS